MTEAKLQNHGKDQKGIILSTTEDLLRSNNCDLTNKIVSMTEAKLQNHGRELEIILSTTENLLHKLINLYVLKVPEFGK